MEEPGHIYILINPSMEGLVKIGKTTRDPESRAKELSQATGVPTPFFVAFSIGVADCHSAEEYVHAILEYNGFKRSPDREFFEMPVRKAIETLMLVEEHLGEQSSTGVGGKSGDDEITSEEHPGHAIFQRAGRIHDGRDDEIQDKKQALRLFYQAKALNYPAAYTSLAAYYIESASDSEAESNCGEAQEHYEKAFDILKEGAQKGHGRCYIKMAGMFLLGYGNRERQSDPQNATKCWRKYFRSQTFVNDDDAKWTDGAWGLDSSYDGGWSRLEHVETYLRQVIEDRIPSDTETLLMLLPLSEQVTFWLRNHIEFLEERQSSNAAEKRAGIERARRVLQAVQSGL